MNKGLTGAIAAGVGVGVAFCFPVVGAALVVGGAASVAGGVLSYNPPPGESYKPLHPFAIIFSVAFLLSSLGMLIALGSLVCDDCITPTNRLLSIEVFFGCMLLSGAGVATSPEYTNEEAAKIVHEKEQRERRAIWDNRFKYYLRNAYNVPEGEKYKALAAQHFKGTAWEREFSIVPSVAALAVSPVVKTAPAQIEEKEQDMISVDGGLHWFTVEQLKGVEHGH